MSTITKKLISTLLTLTLLIVGIYYSPKTINADDYYGDMELKVNNTFKVTNNISVNLVRRAQNITVDENCVYLAMRVDADNDGMEDDLLVIRYWTHSNENSTPHYKDNRRILYPAKVSFTNNNLDDCMVIKNAGHGEVLDMIHTNNGYYFLTGGHSCNWGGHNCSNDTKRDHFSQKLVIFKYETGAYKNYTDYCVLNTEKKGKTNRVLGAFNDYGTELIVRERYYNYKNSKDKNNNKWFTTVYNTSSLLSKATSVGNGVNKTAINLNNIKKNVATYSGDKASYYSTVQGLELSGNYALISSGNGAKSNQYPYYSYFKKNRVKSTYEQGAVEIRRDGYLEAQGLCSYKKHIYFLHVGSLTTKIYISSI